MQINTGKIEMRDDQRAVRWLTHLSNLLTGCAVLFGLYVGLYLVVNRAALDSGLSGLLLLVDGSVVLTLSLSLRLRPVCRARLALVLLSTAVPIWGIEIGLYAVDYSRALLLVVAGRDVRSKLELIEDLQRENIDVYPAISPGHFAADELPADFVVDGQEVYPLSGISEVATVYCNEVGKWTVYFSDEHGFNNPTGLYNTEGAQVAAIGDSFTQGACVNAGEDFVSILRTMFPRSLSLGMGGNGPLIELATLREYAAPSRPQVVLWVFFENDLTDLAIERQSPHLLKYLIDSAYNQGLMDKQAQIDSALRRWVEEQKEDVRPVPRWQHVLFLTSLRSRLGLQLTRTANTQAPEGTWIDQTDMFRTILISADTTVRSWQGRLYFVYLPSLNLLTAAEAVRLHDTVTELVHDLRIPLIDLTPPFAAHPDPPSLFSSRKGGHYNREGYQLVAETIASAIQVNR